MSLTVVSDRLIFLIHSYIVFHMYCILNPKLYVINSQWYQRAFGSLYKLFLAQTATLWPYIYIFSRDTEREVILSSSYMGKVTGHRKLSLMALPIKLYIHSHIHDRCTRACNVSMEGQVGMVTTTWLCAGCGWTASCLVDQADAQDS